MFKNIFRRLRVSRAQRQGKGATGLGSFRCLHEDYRLVFARHFFTGIGRACRRKKSPRISFWNTTACLFGNDRGFFLFVFRLRNGIATTVFHPHTVPRIRRAARDKPVACSITPSIAASRRTRAGSCAPPWPSSGHPRGGRHAGRGGAAAGMAHRRPGPALRPFLALDLSANYPPGTDALPTLVQMAAESAAGFARDLTRRSISLSLSLCTCREMVHTVVSRWFCALTGTIRTRVKAAALTN